MKPVVVRDVAFLLGLPFNVITMEETVADAVETIRAGVPSYYITPNSDFIAQAHTDAALKEILFHADRVVCDGMPLVWLSRYFKPVLPERVAGSDLVFHLFAKANIHKWKVYFLGSDEATLRETKTILKGKYPNMEVVGTFSPPFGKVEDWPNDAILQDVQRTKPDLLLVAVGCPKQEYWIAKYYEAAAVPLSIGIGASLDFICGSQVRAPKWIQRVGMEWFWRMLSDPKRLAKRYAKDFYYLFTLAFEQWRLTRSRPNGARSNTHQDGDSSSRLAEAGAPSDPPVHRMSWAGAVERSNLAAAVLPPDYERSILLDVSAVSGIDSSGLGRLAQIARRSRQAGVAFALIRPAQSIVKLIKAMRMEPQFPCYDDETSALRDITALSAAQEPIEAIRIERADDILPKGEESS